MRSRVGNPYNEGHGADVIHHDFVAPWRTDPHALPDLIERVVPALRLALRQEDKEADSFLFGRGPVVNGWIVTHRRLDALHIDIGLYTRACAVAGCRAGHWFWQSCADLTCGLEHVWREHGPSHRKAIRFDVAPIVAPECLEAIKAAVGEHPTFRLGRGPERDGKVLRALGFGHRPHGKCRDCRDTTEPPLRDLDRPFIHPPLARIEVEDRALVAV